MTQSCDNCKKRWSHRCEEWKQNKNYPGADQWCYGWRKGLPDADLARIDTLVDRINKQTAEIKRMEGRK